MSMKKSNQLSTQVFFVVLGLLTAIVMLKVELPLLLGMNETWEEKIDPYRWSLHVHAVFASIALFGAPIQFFPNFRSNHLRIHRAMGMLYILSIFISAPIGIYIAVEYLSGLEKWAGLIQGVLWLGTTYIAILRARNRDYVDHKIWMMRSYALTLTFVLSRLIIDVLKIEISSAYGGNGGLLLFMTILVIVVSNILCLESRTDQVFN